MGEESQVKVTLRAEGRGVLRLAVVRAFLSSINWVPELHVHGEEKTEKVGCLEGRGVKYRTQEGKRGKAFLCSSGQWVL